MRLYWIAMLAALLSGAVGGWALWSDADQYSSTLRTYSEVSVTYEPQSFRWTDDRFGGATVEMRVVNASGVATTVENIDVHLTFSGAFAGSSYARFQPVALAAGEERVLAFTIQITAPSIQATGGTATLGITGDATVAFEGLERDLHLPVRSEIGVVPGGGT